MLQTSHIYHRFLGRLPIIGIFAPRNWDIPTEQTQNKNQDVQFVTSSLESLFVTFYLFPSDPSTFSVSSHLLRRYLGPLGVCDLILGSCLVTFFGSWKCHLRYAVHAVTRYACAIDKLKELMAMRGLVERSE